MKIQPCKHLQGVLTLPADKSILHRALIIAALHSHTTTIEANDWGDDNQTTIDCLKQLGVRIECDDSTITVQGVGPKGLKAPSTPLDCKNSGTTMRLLAGVLAAQSFASTLIGDASLSARPMNRIVDPLQQMGANIQSTDGHAPLNIEPVSSLSPLTYDCPVASAQVESALLLAGMCAGVAVEVKLPGVVRDHTRRMLDFFATQSGDVQITIPGDFSTAAFFIIGGLIAPFADITLKNVGVNPTRSALLKYVILMGGRVHLSNHRWLGHEPIADIHIQQAKKLFPIRIQPNDTPILIDELPILMLCAAAADGTSTFSELGELRVKESDRLAGMMDMFDVLGVKYDSSLRGAKRRSNLEVASCAAHALSIHGSPQFQGGTIATHGDHRLVMTATMAALRAKGPITLDDAKSASISCKPFFHFCRTLGFKP